MRKEEGGGGDVLTFYGFVECFPHLRVAFFEGWSGGGNAFGLEDEGYAAGEEEAASPFVEHTMEMFLVWDGCWS